MPSSMARNMRLQAMRSVRLTCVSSPTVLVRVCSGAWIRARSPPLWTTPFRGRHQPGSASFSSSVANDALEVLTSSAAGRGFFARRRLHAGERILSESPISMDNLEDLACTILANPTLRDGLHCPTYVPKRENPPPGCSQEAWSRAMAQAASNGFRAPGGKMLLMAQTSLFNHSCNPNAAVYAHDTDEDKVQVRVLRDVGEGQEVAICYDSALYSIPTERRQHELQHRWGFACGCPRCIRPAAGGGRQAEDESSVDALLNKTSSSNTSHDVAALEAEIERCVEKASKALHTASLILDAVSVTPSAPSPQPPPPPGGGDSSRMPQQHSSTHASAQAQEEEGGQGGRWVYEREEEQHALYEREEEEHALGAAVGSGTLLVDAVGMLREALVVADGFLHVTHWRVQQTLKVLCRCLWLQHQLIQHTQHLHHHPHPHPHPHLLQQQQQQQQQQAADADLGREEAPDIALLRRMLHVAMTAEGCTAPALHPMRLELYSIWSALPPSADAWKTVGVFDDLRRLHHLWHSPHAPLPPSQHT